jgi:peptidoglycan pentaglycine glycine transferase (the first glycine)
VAECKPCVEQVLSAEEWDALVTSSGRAHFLQSSTWAQFKSAHGWQARLYRIGAAGRPLALASLLRRGWTAVPFAIGYVPRGPVLCTPQQEALELALAALEQVATQEQLLFVKVEPELFDLPWHPQAISILERRGWRKGQDIQFRNTVLLDISQGEEQILAAMKPKTRYNIRLAARRGVLVSAATPEEWPGIYALYRETARRDGFIIRAQSYYLDLWRNLVSAGIGVVLKATWQGQLLAALVAVAFGHKAWYLHGASSSEGRNLMPTYLLQWEAIRWARARGCTLYDMWGAPDQLSEADSMAGVLRYKLGFGGQFCAGLGAWDYAPWPRLYSAYVRLFRLYTQARASWHRKRERLAAPSEQC